jgi:hypothetical protein
VSKGVRLFPAVHGHIADSVRDHESGPVACVGSGFITVKVMNLSAVSRTAKAGDVVIQRGKPCHGLPAVFHVATVWGSNTRSWR